MEIVTILRRLWERRFLVGLVALTAIAVGWVLAYSISFPPEPRGYKVGVATARILVDTPRSQVIAVAPRGSETLGSRASVLANLMVDGEVKATIIRRAGLQPSQLLAAAEAANDPEEVTPEAAPEVASKDYSITTSVVMNSDQVELPIIKVVAEAPNAKRAMRLANAAISGLSDYLDSKAAVEQIPDARRLRVSGLGTAQANEATRGPSPMVALAVAIFVFLGGCAAILIAFAVARGWRVAAASEEGDYGELARDHSSSTDFFDSGSVELFVRDSGTEIVDEPIELWSELPDLEVAAPNPAGTSN